MTDNPLEIPQAMRDLAEQNMKQAHAAYEQLTDFVTEYGTPTALRVLRAHRLRLLAFPMRARSGGPP